MNSISPRIPRKIPTAALLLVAGLACAQPQTRSMVIGGLATKVDVSAPATGEPGKAPGTVVMAHGFTRDRTNMAGHAAALARAGYWVVVPDLPYLMDSRDNAVALRDLLAQLRAGVAGPMPDRFVMIGFSAGGLSALLASDSPGVVGFVGLDPFDRPGGVGLEAARKLRIPAYLLRGPSAACNAYAIAEPWVKALPNLVEDRQILDASHCDFEAPTDRLCQFVCGDADPKRQAAVQDFILGAVRQLLPSGPGLGSPPANGEVRGVAGEAEQ